MHATLSTLGTDGDVLPHIGLGARLRARGHRVTLAAPEPYRAVAESEGLAFHPLVTAAEFNEMVAHPHLFHPLLSGRMMAEWGSRFLRRHYDALADLTASPDSILVTNPGVLPARLVGEKLGRPVASLLLQPGLIPSTIAPPQMTGGLTLPAGLPASIGHLYWAAVDTAGYVLVARPLNRLRAQLNLPPIRRLFQWWLSPDLVIALFPAMYAPPQPDWPPQLHLAGFGHYDGVRSDCELDPDLRAFLDAGPPPLAFTLGTGMTHAQKFFRAAVAATKRLGARALLLTKYPHQLPRDLPPSIRHQPYAPFRGLLPRCAALVHHGGIGTTAAALAAATPQLILPLAWDQPDNAARVARLGVGASLAPRRRTGAHVARALSEIMSPGTRVRCRVVAAQLGSTDGLDNAANLLEQCASCSLTTTCTPPAE